MDRALVLEMKAWVPHTHKYAAENFNWTLLNSITSLNLSNNSKEELYLDDVDMIMILEIVTNMIELTSLNLSGN